MTDVTTLHTAPRRMDEPLRPQYHYTAEKNMINDPNGLVYLDGEWHLFHQYNQHEVVHWGHAVSTDLVHWEHLPPALFPDALGQIYSGTAVADVHNTSGLRTGANTVLVAAFTYADHHDGTQSQGIAYSNDRGRSWTMHDANPVLPNPGQKDFRDPKIFWHEPSHSWILIITGGHHLEFYRSPDLVSWTLSSAWGAEDGSHGGVWECPDLFELTIDGSSETRWVASVSIDRGGPASGSGMQYFIGSFDGYRFMNDNPPQTVLWQNWGQDYYAGITWENVPASDGRRIMIAWADNWLYRFDVPTDPFNGQLTVPRELRLTRNASNEIRLHATPVVELERLRTSTKRWTSLRTGAEAEAILEVGDAYEAQVTFDLTSSTATTMGVEVRVGVDERTVIGYDRNLEVVFIDRSHSGTIPTPSFTTRHEMPLPLTSEKLKLRIYVDRSSVEVFADGNQLTDLVLPSPESTGFRPFAVGGVAAIEELILHPLARIWDDEQASFAVVSGSWAQTGTGVTGSSSDRALALLSDPAVEHISVTIVGTRHHNPTKVLGEKAAGIALTDETGETGIFATVDTERQLVVVSDIATGEELATEAGSIAVNTPYQFQLARGDNDDLTVQVTGGGVEAQLAGRWGSFSDLGVVTENSEALFVR